MASTGRGIQYTIPAREDFNKLAEEQKTRINEAVGVLPRVRMHDPSYDLNRVSLTMLFAPPSIV